MSSLKFIAAGLSLFGVASYVHALAQEGGGPCTGLNTACSWVAFNSQGNAQTFNGFCAPDGFCGDNGADCSSDDNCYNFCGTGLCGGAGAECSSTAPFTHNQIDVTCYDPAFTCTSDNPDIAGTCVAVSTGGSTKTRHRRTQARNLKRALDQCDGPTESLCGFEDGKDGLNVAWECIDVHSNLERCGGCVIDGVGQDCTTIPGALDVECLVGACAISSCFPGYILQDDACVQV